MVRILLSHRDTISCASNIQGQGQPSASFSRGQNNDSHGKIIPSASNIKGQVQAPASFSHCQKYAYRAAIQGASNVKGQGPASFSRG